MITEEEIFEIVDGDDRVIGQALRSECHGNPGLIHRVAHILVFNGSQQVLLQKRSMAKDIQPGRWDTSVGGHLMPGEGYLAAAVREAQEEVGLNDIDLEFLYYSQIRNNIESENIATFRAFSEGPFEFNCSEIDELRFWEPHEVLNKIGQGVFTPNFEEEWKLYLQWVEMNGKVVSSKNE
ncbi:MAG: NUDIX domain-containing protein [Deltaproteobacteria bacterium]|nr:NUDIX domain-containing protein [Deltaproteobacteria bacterium]